MTGPPELASSILAIDKAEERDLARLAREMCRPAKATMIELPLHMVAVGDLKTAQLPPARFIVEPIIPRGEVTLLSGHGGAGKSTLALTLAAHVACGVSWNGLRCNEGRVLFVSLEDRSDLVRLRLHAICAAYGLDAGKVAQGIVIADGTKADYAALAREARFDGVTTVVPTPAMSQLAEIAAGASLIVIDNASNAADLDEINRARVRAFMRMLARIGRDNDAGMLLLAHIDKHAATRGRAGNTFSGSTAWHNSARSRLALIETNGMLELAHEKANLSAKTSPIRLRFVDHGVLMPSDGAPSESAIESDGADEDAVLSALHAAQLAGCIMPPGYTGAVTVGSALSTFLPESLRGARGRPRLRRALKALLTDGRAEIAEHTTADYKRRKRIVALNPPNRHSAKPPIPPVHSAGEAADSGDSAKFDSAAI